VRNGSGTPLVRPL